MKQGILLLACGHTNYGKMAAALAASIKAVECDAAIVLLHDGKSINRLSEKEIGLFKSLVVLPEELYTNDDGTFNPLKARMFYYDLSPFDRTISIDVDNIWLRKRTPSDAFKALAGVPFTIQNGGYEHCDENANTGISVWANIHDVIAAYKLTGKRFYKTYGDFIYFEKCSPAKKLFTRAKNIFLSEPKAKVHPFIGQRIPDELAFSIAMAQTEVYPHSDEWYATTYFHTITEGKMRFAQPYELAELYFTLSMGGKSSPRSLANTYNILASAAYQKLGLQYPYQWKDKYTFLPTRKTL